MDQVIANGSSGSFNAASNKIKKDEEEDKDEYEELDEESLEAAEVDGDSLSSVASLVRASSSVLPLSSGLLSFGPSGSAHSSSAGAKPTAISNKKKSSGTLVRASVGVTVGAMVLAAFSSLL
jgi:hypothetical protein